MNDMADIFSDCKVCSYADDTQIIVSENSTKQVKAKLEELIKRAQNWHNNNSVQNNA
jgi:ribosomal silencing factor RsfS